MTAWIPSLVALLVGGHAVPSQVRPPAPLNPVPDARVRLPPPPPAHRCRGPCADWPAQARPAGAAMSGRDWQAFDAELRARLPELAVEILGKPNFRAGQEWRWAGGMLW